MIDAMTSVEGSGTVPNEVASSMPLPVVYPPPGVKVSMANRAAEASAVAVPPCAVATSRQQSDRSNAATSISTDQQSDPAEARKGEG